MVCLDTSFLTDVQRGVPDARDVMEELDETGVVAAVPAIVAAEMWTGAFLRSGSEGEATAELLESVVHRDLTPAIAHRGGRIRADLSGRDPGIVDAVIAVTAIEHDEPLVTRDTGFEEVRDVSNLELRLYG